MLGVNRITGPNDPMIFGRNKWPDQTSIDVEGQTLDVRIRLHQRARHFRLTLSRTGEPILTVPPMGKWRQARAFLDQQGPWLADRLLNHPGRVIFAHGVGISFKGEPAVIRGTGRARGQVEIINTDEQLCLLVPGGEKHLARRLTDWLKSQARTALEERTSYHGIRLRVEAKSVRVRGQSTRWGSCSSSGVLNYNWRLVLAPPFVLDYVAAHEVAHLCEMNHSPAFWAKVLETLPDMERGRAWLKTNGSNLMAFGS